MVVAETARRDNGGILEGFRKERGCVELVA